MQLRNEIFKRPGAPAAVFVLPGRIFILLMMWPIMGAAQVDEPIFSEEPSYFDWLDKPRNYISERFVSLSTRVDRFFGDERVFQESRTSYLRFYGDLVLRKAGASDFEPKLQAKLVLPALEKRLKILIESNDNVTGEVPVTSVTTRKGVPNVNVPNDFRAAVQVLLTDSPHWNINTDAGLRFHGLSLPPFVRARASRVQNLQNWQFRLTEAVYWYEQSGAGESTQFDADRKVGEHDLARSRTIATWSDHDQQFDYEQDFFLFHPIDDNHALSYQAGVFGASQPNSHVTDYALSATWRTRLHREWLFFDVQPGLSWPETESFHLTPTILLRVEAVFGDIACGCYGM
jgi:hypothetical protein